MLRKCRLSTIASQNKAIDQWKIMKSQSKIGFGNARFPSNASEMQHLAYELQGVALNT